MHNTERMAEGLQNLPSDGLTHAEFLKQMTPILLKYPNSFEREYDIYKRAQAFKAMIKEHLRSNPLGPGEKLAVVCHSKFIAAMTADSCDIPEPNDNDGKINKAFHGHTFPQNCQILGWDKY